MYTYNQPKRERAGTRLPYVTQFHAGDRRGRCWLALWLVDGVGVLSEYTEYKPGWDLYSTSIPSSFASAMPELWGALPAMLCSPLTVCEESARRHDPKRASTERLFWRLGAAEGHSEGEGQPLSNETLNTGGAPRVGGCRPDRFRRASEFPQKDALCVTVKRSYNDDENDSPLGELASSLGRRPRKLVLNHGTQLVASGTFF